MMKRQISRRFFLRATSAGIVGVAGAGLLAACGGDSNPTATTAPAAPGDPTATTAPVATTAPGEPTPTTAPAATPAPGAPTATTAVSAPDPTATVEEEPALGSSLIGELEGPVIVTDPARWPSSFNEAPQLAAMVAAGQLPPVVERIGAAPIVVEPLHEIGTYGGTWRRGFTGPGDTINGMRVAGLDNLIGWHWDGLEFAPKIAQSWELAEDGTSIELMLRPGMCWSDGVPFTADNFMWWYENMFQNDEILPVKTTDMIVNRKPGRIVKVEDYIVRFEWDDPNFLILDNLASGLRSLAGQSGNNHVGNGGYAPGHYLEQFHASFADPEALAKAVSDEGVDNWVELFKAKARWSHNPEVPVITPWKTTSPANTPTWVLERNPYSVWVDIEGNQLPYIDDIVMTLAENLEVLNLRAIAGEYDFQARHIDLSKLPVILENRERSGYNVHLDTGDYGADVAIIFNFTYDADPEIAQWMNNPDFRRALSLGVERDQINEIFFLGTGTPGSPAPAESTIFSPGPEFRTLWSTYEPEQANDMLDSIGLDQKDGDGFRQRSDGQGRLRLELMTRSGSNIPYTQIAEMISTQWREIGIDVTVREVERTLSDTIIDANEHMLYAWTNDGSESLFANPKGVVIRGSDSSGPLYGLWYSTGGERGVEPPAEIRANMEKFDRAFSVPREEQIEIGQELWTTALEQVYTIGVVGLSAASMGVRIVKNNMGNIPARQVNSPAVKNPSNSIPPTFFFKD